jgi:HEAT repeat protein
VPAQQSAAVALNKPVRAQIEALKNSDSVARWSAVTALPTFRPDPERVPALVEALRDSYADVRTAAAEALDAIGPEASIPETHRDKISCSIFQKQTLERPSSNGFRGSQVAVGRPRMNFIT